MKRYKLGANGIGTLLALSLLALSMTNAIYADTTNKNLYHRFFASVGTGYTWSTHATFTDGEAKGAPYVQLYGPHNSTGDFGSSPNFYVEMGYRFYPALIPSLSLNYIPRANFTGNANYANTGSIQPVSSTGYSLSLMMNNKIDVYDFIKQLMHSTKTSRIHPVIGAGIGISNNYNSSQVQYFPKWNVDTNPTYPYAYTSLPSANTLNFAYNVFAGLAFQITKATFIEADYIYMHLGKIKTGSGSMNLYNHGCGAYKEDNERYGKACVEAIDETQANYNTQGILLKLTHYF